MKKLIIYFSGQYLNVEADHIEDDGKFLKAYDSGNELIAMFDIAVVDAAYISKKKDV